jgi:hypothetical protein
VRHVDDGAVKCEKIVVGGSNVWKCQVSRGTGQPRKLIMLLAELIFRAEINPRHIGTALAGSTGPNVDWLYVMMMVYLVVIWPDNSHTTYPSPRRTVAIYGKGDCETALMGIIKNDEDILCAYAWT